MSYKKQFCPKGHDTFVCGRYLNSECKECSHWSNQSIMTKNKQWETALQKRYSITVEDYNNLFNLQNGCCAICFRHQSLLKKRLNVDHDHNTNKVRGLLCNFCNRIIVSTLENNKHIFNNAIKYLDKFKVT